jgi:hypothetical protein
VSNLITNLVILGIVSILNIPINQPFIPCFEATPGFYKTVETKPIKFLSKNDLKGYAFDSRYRPKDEILVGFLTSSHKLLGPFEQNAFYIGMNDFSTGFSQGLAPVKKNGLWGYVDHNGNVKIDFQFLYANIFQNNFAVVETSDGCKYIDKDGNFVFDKTFDDACMFDRDVALVMKDDLYGFINSSGDLICDYEYTNLEFPTFSEAPTSNEIMVLYKNDLCGYVRVTSDSVTPLTDFKYYKLRPYTNSSEHEFVKAIKKGDEYVEFILGFMDDEFKEIFSYTESDYQFVDELYDGLHHFATAEGFHGFMDENFNTVIKPKFHYAKTFSHGLCIVENLEQSGLIDISGNFVLDFQDVPIKTFSVDGNDLILRSDTQNNGITATIKNYFTDGISKIDANTLVWTD